MEPTVLTPEDYVAQLYRLMLRREADLEGVTHHSQSIRKTGDHTRVLHALLESEEYRNLYRPGQRDPLDLETGGAASIRFGAIMDLARSHPVAGLPVGLDILVPVHNAAEWLHTICDAYETLDARPLYVVDGASADDSLAILQRRGERVFTVHNPDRFVEPMLSRIIPYLAGQWILRMDDDELPTKDTFAWIREHIGRVGEVLIGLPRRWARSSNGRIESCTAADGAWNQDPQFRLFRPGSVRPISTLHTPGVEAETRLIATPEAGIIHLDWLVRGEVERKRKVSRYEEHETNKGWIFKSLYLPEQMSHDYYQAEPIVDEVVLAACRRLLATTGATGSDWPVLQR